MTKHEYISFGYLSGLKCHLSGLYNIDHTDNEKVNPIAVEIVGIGLREVEIHEIGRTITEHYEICDCFPILKPLSEYKDLEDSLGLIYCNEIFRVIKGWQRKEDLPFIVIKKLIENHFDIFGLIDKKEAVDYNTLPDFVF